MFRFGGQPDMPTAENYAQNADECLEAAKRARDETERMILTALAEQWLRRRLQKAKRNLARARRFTLTYS
jgi:hypothetical protein